MIQIDPNGQYTVTLSGLTVVTILEGLQEVPKRRADPACEELGTQVAMLIASREGEKKL